MRAAVETSLTVRTRPHWPHPNPSGYLLKPLQQFLINRLVPHSCKDLLDFLFQRSQANSFCRLSHYCSHRWMPRARHAGVDVRRASYSCKLANRYPPKVLCSSVTTATCVIMRARTYVGCWRTHVRACTVAQRHAPSARYRALGTYGAQKPAP